METRYHTREAFGMLVLRLGLAWFIFVWAVNKFFAPQQYQFILKRFDGIEAGFAEVYALASVQVAVCVLVALGLWRGLSYAALAAMHALTILRIWPALLDPFRISEKGFPVNRNSVIALSVMLAMIALWSLRHRDHWSLDAWRARRKD